MADGKPSPQSALSLVRFLAADSRFVFLGDHARERMEERDILDVDVFRVLRNGQIRGNIRAGKAADEWVIKVVDRIRGQREVGVVTVIIRKSRLFVMTVEWEDMR
jgi:Domain of unknown function (DUF4258)